MEENNKLGGFVLKGILPAPAEEPEIEVAFKVDEDCILHVTMKTHSRAISRDYNYGLHETER